MQIGEATCDVNTTLASPCSLSTGKDTRNPLPKSAVTAAKCEAEIQRRERETDMQEYATGMRHQVLAESESPVSVKSESPVPKVSASKESCSSGVSSLSSPASFRNSRPPKLALQQLPSTVEPTPRPPASPKQSMSPKTRKLQSQTPNGSRPGSPAGARSPRALFDRLTIRQMFMEMDVDSSGEVSKQEFKSYFLAHPKIKGAIAHKRNLAELAEQGFNTSDQPNRESGMSAAMAEAIEMRRVLKLLKHLDTNQSGSLDFDEFLAFFQTAGYLVEYESRSPRDQMDELMAKLQDQRANASPDERTESSLLSDMNSLGKSHLSLAARRRSENIFNKTADPNLPEVCSARRRHSSGSAESFLPPINQDHNQCAPRRNSVN
eukprot:gnl/MRDRNA2_/MRDRNA2_84477_c0_seq3.p1 gnl/MRDRNA2_/MRDRNA2_84477_c0~~gnl/MRDRNA2_/MRDRNA2_84477_c0_seq3.p1  ORF type:complete len:378 (+),score=72.11 gnl/MRDRNA2_/MRDRNA2_84477_c0_seq3:117-1250(+)